MANFINTVFSLILQPRIFAGLILAFSVVSLAFALIAEHFFGLEPCILCLYQRIPFAMALLLGAAGLVYPHRLIVGLIGLTYLSNVGLAGFHSGVERGWWQGTESCGAQIDPTKLTNIDDIRAHIMAAPTARCDEIPWQLFGLSMTNYVLVASLAITILAVIIVLQGKQNSGGKYQPVDKKDH